MAVAYHQGRFPPGALDWPQLLPLIGPAAAAVARYEGVLHGIPNPNVLLSPLTTQEALEPTARRILRLVRENDLLRDLWHASGQRPAVLAFPELLNICEGRDAF